MITSCNDRHLAVDACVFAEISAIITQVLSCVFERPHQSYNSLKFTPYFLRSTFPSHLISPEWKSTVITSCASFFCGFTSSVLMISTFKVLKAHFSSLVYWLESVKLDPKFYPKFSETKTAFFSVNFKHCFTTVNINCQYSVVCILSQRHWTISQPVSLEIEFWLYCCEFWNPSQTTLNLWRSYL